MPTTIRASCPDCGDIDLTVKDVSVRVCLEDNRGAYVFRCPECSFTVSKPAEPRVIDLLVSSGVKMLVWRLPSELFEQHDGPVIDHDDLMTFHAQLQEPGWFDDLLRLVND